VTHSRVRDNLSLTLENSGKRRDWTQWSGRGLAARHWRPLLALAIGGMELVWLEKAIRYWSLKNSYLWSTFNGCVTSINLIINRWRSVLWDMYREGKLYPGGGFTFMWASVKTTTAGTGVKWHGPQLRMTRKVLSRKKVRRLWCRRKCARHPHNLKNGAEFDKAKEL